MKDHGSDRVDLTFEPDFHIGNLHVRPSAREVVCARTVEILEPKVMQVLVALSGAAGTIVTRDELLRKCWDGRIVSEDAINRVICKLRAVAELDGGRSFRIETVPRVGHRMLLDVPEGAEARRQPGRAPAPAAERQGPAAALARAFARPRRSLAAAASILVATAGLTAASQLHRAEASPASLAVLPFADLSPQQSCRFFGQGVAEEIMAGLAAQPELRVVGRSAVNGLEPNADHQRVREQLGVSHILEGSVNHRHKNEYVRVTVRLVRASDGAQVWARSFDRPLNDVFAIQREIGLAVASQIVEKPLDLPARPSTDWDTYKLYATAQGMLQERDRKRSQSAALMLKEAVERDTRYTPAKAALARAKAQLGGI